MLRGIDWSLVMFVGTSMLQEYWTVWGLPKMYYWEVKKQHMSELNEDDNNNKAA
ncbi:hypothetical protein [Radiobacillus sp. PE A8.2]|uniref:hypothetical protein n=1 Tax=Radiobacillus sp. PE A8.2 TaxID=3380349 RepID=UPI003890C632